MLRHKRNDIPYEARGGGVQGWEELINGLVQDYGPIGNSVAEQIIAPDFNIPRFYLAPGRVLRYLLTGVIANTGPIASTLTFRVRWGGVGGVLLNATGAINIQNVANGFNNFRWCGEINCRSAGPTGTIYSSGEIVLANELYTATPTQVELTANMLSATGGPTAANAPVAVDTSIDKLLSFTGQFSVANAGLQITTQQALLEALN